MHVDEFNVEAYEHTALLYLSDDFEGGRFAMYDGDGGDPHDVVETMKRDPSRRTDRFKKMASR